MIEDRIFGDLMEEPTSLARHRLNLLGVKHLNRLTPSVPVPDQPVTLTLTTAGPLAFEAARCWYTLEPTAAPA